MRLAGLQHTFGVPTSPRTRRMHIHGCSFEYRTHLPELSIRGPTYDLSHEDLLCSDSRFIDSALERSYMELLSSNSRRRAFGFQNRDERRLLTFRRSFEKALWVMMMPERLLAVHRGFERRRYHMRE